MMQYFNENGWKCTKMRFDPCLFHIISPAGNTTYLLVHVDDCDLISQLASDSALIIAVEGKGGVLAHHPPQNSPKTPKTANPNMKTIMRKTEPQNSEK